MTGTDRSGFKDLEKGETIMGKESQRGLPKRGGDRSGSEGMGMIWRESGEERHSYRAKVWWAITRKELTQGSKVTNSKGTTYIPMMMLMLSHFSCVRLCVTPIDGSPPGSPIPGILQARTLECVAISFSNA